MLTFWVYIAPLAEFLIISYMYSAAGRRQWGWLLVEGEVRGIALVCLFAGLIMVVAAGLVFLTRSYRRFTELYANAPAQELPSEGAAFESNTGRGKGDAAIDMAIDLVTVREGRSGSAPVGRSGADGGV